MTVANNYAPIRQLGNGVTTAFSGSWSMINAANAVVTLESVTTGVRTPVTQGSGTSQYTISITSSGFTVTFNTAPSSSYYVNISRSTVLAQTNSYTTSSGFQGQVEENSFDALTAMVQDAAYNASQSIAIPTGESLTTLLPSAALRANGYLTFDASGNVTVSAGVTGVTVSSAMQPVVSANTLALARTAMGVQAATTYPPFTEVLVTRITSSTTFTRQTNTVSLSIECFGGGAGAGGTGSNVGGTAGGGGGGTGSRSIKTVTAAIFGSSQTVTIGGGGSGGTALSGNAGGTTSVGTLCVANGGYGGPAGTSAGTLGGAGGAAGTGDITGTGCPGGNGGGSVITTVAAWAGAGGSTLVGGGGVPVTLGANGTINGNNGTGYGSGGGGSVCYNSNSNATGGNGAPGLVVITEIISL